MPLFDHRRARRQLAHVYAQKKNIPFPRALMAVRHITDNEIEDVAAETYRESNPQDLTLGSGFGSHLLQVLLDKFMASGAIDKLFEKLVDKLLGMLDG